MTRMPWIATSLILLTLVSAQAEAQCRQLVSVANPGPADEGALSVNFGVAQSITVVAGGDVTPDAPPICGPASPGGGMLNGQIVVSWPADCVDPGSVVTLEVQSDQSLVVSGVASWVGSGLDATPTFAADCNLNCVADPIDILDGTSMDLDGDTIPDECSDVVAVPTATPISLAVLAILLATSAISVLMRSRP